MSVPSFPSLPLFPLVFSDAEASLGFNTEHTQNDFAHVFDAKQEDGLWRFNLGGGKILASFIDQWDAFHSITKGAWKPFLFRLASRRFEILKDQPGGIGTGDGVRTEFQLIKTRSYEYAPANLETEIVRHPHHLFPPVRIPHGNGQGTLLYPTEQVRVWVNGIEQILDTHWSIDRETGLITFVNPPANGAAVQAACKFWIACHGSDLMPMKHGASVYTLASSAELFQVPGE